MSKPPLDPKKTAAGIALDPQTLERVIPESKRADGTVRKQIKIRPGFTPQEDVRRFRGSKQAQMDANALPKGHIIGWVPPPESQASAAKPMSKSAKKNAKRREKKKEDNAVPENWDEDDADDREVAAPLAARTPEEASSAPERTSSAAANTASNDTDDLSSKMEKLAV